MEYPCTQAEEEKRSVQAVHMFHGLEQHFPMWRVRLEMALRRMGVLEAIKRDPESESYWQTPERETTEAKATRLARIDARLRDDSEAMNLICSRLTDVPLRVIMGKTTAKAMMDALHEQYQKRGVNVSLGLRRRLYGLKEAHFSSLTELFSAHHDIIYQLELIEDQITYSEKVQTLLNAIPDRFSGVLNAITVMKRDDFDALSLASIKRIFLNAEIGLKRQEVEENVGLVANQRKKKSTKLLHIECFNCGGKGHYQNKCPEKPSKRAYSQVADAEDSESIAGGMQDLALVANKRRVTCVLDSGASDHMFKDSSVIQGVRRLKRPVEISIAKDGETLGAKRKGFVKDEWTLLP